MSWTLQSSIISKLLELWAANLRKKPQKAESVPFGSNVQKWSEQFRNIKKHKNILTRSGCKMIRLNTFDRIVFPSWNILNPTGISSSVGLPQKSLHQSTWLHSSSFRIHQSRSKTDRNGSITIYTWKNWVRTTPQKVRKFPAKVRKYPQKYANRDFLTVGILRIFLKPSKTVLLCAFTAWSDQKAFIAMFLHHSVGET